MKLQKRIVGAVSALVLGLSSLYVSAGTLADQPDKNSQSIVYVAADGRKGAEGTKDDPFASITEARDYLRTLRLDASNRATVYIREGNYAVTKEEPVIQLGEQDSYVTYEACPGEKVTLTGTITLSNSNFKKLSQVTGEQFSSQSRLTEEMKDQVYVYDLGAEGISTGEILKNGFNWPKQAFQPELIVDGTLQTLAQYPNKEEPVMTMSQILAGKTKNGLNEDQDAKAAGANEGERPRNYWFDKTDHPKTYEEMLIMKGPVFYTRNGLEQQIADWAPPTVENEPQDNQPEVHENADHTRYETDGWLSGYFENNYANDMSRIYSVDVNKQTIHCKYPSMQGVQDKRIQMTAINLLCELDQEGEYYIDRYQNHDVLYYYPQNGEIGDKTIALTSSNAPFFQLEGAREVQIKGITMTGSTGYGVIMEDCESCIIEDCEFSNISLDAVKIGKNNNTITTDPAYITSGGGHNNKVRNCLIHDMGCGGVYLAGGDEQSLERGNNIVEHCEIYHISRLQTYTPAVYLEGVGNIARFNYIHDAPHMVIQIMGNDMLVTRNHIENVCTNTNDQAPIYSGRCFNWLGNQITYNLIENIPAGCFAVYMDDGMSGMIIRKNIFKDITGTALFSNNGYGHQITDNIFINTGKTISYKQYGGIRPIPNEKILKYRYYRAFREGDGENFSNTTENMQYWYSHYKKLYPYLEHKYFPEETDEAWNTDEKSLFVPSDQILNRMVVVGTTISKDTEGIAKYQKDGFDTEHCLVSDIESLGLDLKTGKIKENSVLAEESAYGAQWIADWNTYYTTEGMGLIKGEEPEIPEEPEYPFPTENPSATDNPDKTDVPDKTEGPDITDNPGETKEPSNTNNPGETKDPSNTDNPSETEEPGNTDNPGENEKPDYTDSPDNSEQPGHTDHPDNSENPDDSESPVIPGDVNQDGNVNLADVQKILMAALKIITLEGNELEAADLDRKEGITLMDAQLLLRVVLKMESIS